MRALNIVVEGETEERFVKDCLREYLQQFNVFAVPRLIGGVRHTRGAYEVVKKFIQNWLKEDNNRDSRFTTMLDYYALPASFPGFAGQNRVSDKYQKISILENSFKDDIGSWRFIPYIQLHEFETLLFVKPECLKSYYPDVPDEAIEELVRQTHETGNPELINDCYATAPSRRIIKQIPEYDGAKIGGALTAKAIGILQLKASCQHFRQWIATLENFDTR